MSTATDADIFDWAERFWLLAGESEPFPRSMERAVSKALPLAVVKLPHLDGEGINNYLQHRHLKLDLPTHSRQLRGCLLAGFGSGIVFLDGTDPPDQLRFSLAHEVAHFLLDHLKPRQEAVHALGTAIQDVLDGVREPTPDERLSAILQGISFERFEHYLDRQADGSIARREILEAEDRADLLALELLAPLRCIEESLAAQSASWSDAAAAETVKNILQKEYGLPRDVANGYARFLIRQHAPEENFRGWLRGKN